MEIDEDKIDDAVLALLWLTRHNGRCAWKGSDRVTTDRLYQKGFIGDPVNSNGPIVTAFKDISGCANKASPLTTWLTW